MPERAVVADASDDPYADEPATHDLVGPGIGNAGCSPDPEA